MKVGPMTNKSKAHEKTTVLNEICVFVRPWTSMHKIVREHYEIYEEIELLWQQEIPFIQQPNDSHTNELVTFTVNIYDCSHENQSGCYRVWKKERNY